MYAPPPEVAEDVYDADLPEPTITDETRAHMRQMRKRAALQLACAFAGFFSVRLALEFAGFYQWVEHRFPAWKIPALVFSQAVAGTIVVATLLRVFRESSASVGFEKPKRPWREIGRGFLTVFLVYVMQIPLALAVMLILRGPARQQMVSRKTEILQEFVRMPMVMILPCAIAAGMYEEVLVRGLIQSRMSRVLCGSDQPSPMQRFWAVLFGAILFGAGHWYQGPVGIAQTLFAGLVFGACAAYWRSLWPAIVAHTLIDTVSLTVAYFVVPAAQRILAR